MIGLIEARKGTTSAGKIFQHDTLLAGQAAQFGRAIVREHGQDPCLRKQAAFHEAGHAIVLAAFGTRIKSCEIRKRRVPHSYSQLWLGITLCESRSWNQDYSSEDGNSTMAVQSTEYLIRTGMDTLAGVAGELHSATWHPASSIDENVIGLGIAGVLDARYGLAHGMSAILLMALTTKILDQHKSIFLELGHLLSKQKKLSSGVVAQILRDVEPCANAQALFAGAMAQFRVEGGAV